MKKILSILIAAGLAVLSVSAQETEKKQYLPEEGDWAIGFDASPVLKYVGNLFNGNTNNTLEAVGGDPVLPMGDTAFDNPTVSLMGKYMLTDELAVRANIGVRLNNDNTATYVADDKATLLDPLSEAKVVDYKNTRTTEVYLTAGAEYRVGKKRVQGVFGGGILFGLDKQLATYTYGNELTPINNDGYRPLKEFSAGPTSYYAGLVGSAGVEFFVAPKISLGAEVNLVAAYRFKQQTYTISEGYNTSTEVIEQKTDLVNPPVASFSLGTQNLGGSLYLAFYF